MLQKVTVFICLLLLSLQVVASDEPTHATKAFELTLGEDYQLVQTAHPIALPDNDNKIVIQEFFSYGCPWCQRIETALTEWRKKQPSYVEFQQIPVSFKSGWDYYAKAYYLAHALGIEEKVGPTLFDVILNKKRNLTSNQAMISFFKEQGVDEHVAKNAFTSSISIDAKVAEGMKVMKAYQVYMIPSIIVDGKYNTNLAMAKSSTERLLMIVDALIEKRKQEKKIS